MRLTPQQLFNLKPNAEGIVSATIKGLPKFSKVFMIACDERSITQRQYSVSDLLKIEKTELEKQAETTSILKKDLRQNQKIPVTNEDGSTTGGLIQ